MITAVHDREGLVAAMRAGLAPRFVFFWGHRPPADGSVGKTCFSQWYEAGFDVDGQHYPTAEHFMMAEKARLFGDRRILERILVAKSAAVAKRLGREVAGFEAERWTGTRFDIVVRGNQAKFSQNGPLGAFLRNTGDRVLVEASPVDAVWGIGLAADHADAPHPDRWRGLNLLGFALMEVRARLG